MSAEEPRSSDLSSAFRDRLQDMPPSAKLEDPRYPRSRFLRVLRWVVLRSYLVALSYPVVVLGNLLFLVESQGPASLQDPTLLGRALLIDRMFEFFRSNPLVFALVLLLVAFSFVSGFLAQRDYRRERSILFARFGAVIAEDAQPNLPVATSSIDAEPKTASSGLIVNLIQLKDVLRRDPQMRDEARADPEVRNWFGINGSPDENVEVVLVGSTEELGQVVRREISAFEQRQKWPTLFSLATGLLGLIIGLLGLILAIPAIGPLLHNIGGLFQR